MLDATNIFLQVVIKKSGHWTKIKKPHKNCDTLVPLKIEARRGTIYIYIYKIKIGNVPPNRDVSRP